MLCVTVVLSVIQVTVKPERYVLRSEVVSAMQTVQVLTYKT